MLKLFSILTLTISSLSLFCGLVGCSQVELKIESPLVSQTHSTTIQTRLVSGGVQGTIQWGINGHPGMQEAYKGTCNGFHVSGSTAQEGISVETQLDLVKSSGATWYRIDFPEGVYRNIPGKAFLKCIVDSALIRGIKILVVLKPVWACALQATVCPKTKDFPYFFAKDVASDPDFQNKIAAWELENELDVLSIAPNSYGTSPQDYPYFPRVFNVIRSLLNGLTSTLPNAITTVDFAETHYGFINRLKSELELTNLWSKLSAVGWHAYELVNPSDPTKNAGFSFLSVKNKLVELQKPIWLTEGNTSRGSFGGEQNQANDIKTLSKTVLASKDIAMLFIYELLDEPYFGDQEAHYGFYNITKLPPSTTWNLGSVKLALKEFKLVINQGSNINAFIQAFYMGGLGRNPDGIGFMNYSGLLRDAYRIDNAAMLNAARVVGNSIFTSSEYVTRLRSNRDYVFDLYAAYNHRVPDTGGWDFWTSRIATVGRDVVRSEISTQAEFLNIVSQMSPQ